MAAAGSAPKAWRFAGEMREIASTFGSADLPRGFHQAAAEVYDRLERFRLAQAAYQQALVISPENPSVLNNLA